ncbi:hypothetical protein QR77_21035 [Streptomyces sp. 150FB]|uniref:hypothetical protein n=1 Tax=Streptomyces sp. 150FB TaxID=1576605 RepID=UPI00058952D5|nr:hypothetical protein [Streptomyces sp. 150FB]KIF75704.1 hypothetical protein QR77_21035 [Streptomyces sp. 150FB]
MIRRGHRVTGLTQRPDAVTVDIALISAFSPEWQALRSLLSKLIIEQPALELTLAERLSGLYVRYPSRDAAAHPLVGLRVNNGVWAFGAESYGDLLRKTKHYTLEGVADRITAPTLIMDAENAQFFKGQPQEAEKALVNAPTTLVTLTDAEGAGEHCHMGAMLLAHQTMFDWLDDTLAVG